MKEYMTRAEFDELYANKIPTDTSDTGETIYYTYEDYLWNREVESMFVGMNDMDDCYW